MVTIHLWSMDDNLKLPFRSIFSPMALLLPTRRELDILNICFLYFLFASREEIFKNLNCGEKVILVGNNAIKIRVCVSRTLPNSLNGVRV